MMIPHSLPNDLWLEAPQDLAMVMETPLTRQQRSMRYNKGKTGLADRGEL